MSDAAKAFLHDRQAAYRRLFESPDGKLILEDMARFCRANESTFDPDPRTHALLEGRREVWLRIQHHIQLSDEEIWRLYIARK